METSFLLIFLFFQALIGLSSNTMPLASSNVSCIERERQSLLIFKQTLTKKYDLLSTWSGVECCEWHGVGCDSRNGHVVKLDLRSTNFSKRLVGKLSPSLQDLKHLRYMDLSVNNFSGDIPEFLGSFVYLEYLNLSTSGFSGVVPHHLGNLSRLQYLDLSFVTLIDGLDRRFRHVYNFRDSWPSLDDLGWVSSLQSLRHLELSEIIIGKHIDWFHPLNMLPSLLTLNLACTYINIPSIKFVNFTSLNSLDLSGNFINSNIPVWLSNLTGLMHLNLANNDFHGDIPDFLGTFNALASIHLSYNSFDTPMPDLLCNLSSLVSLGLSGNKFSGHIPSSIGLLLRLEDLYLQENQLSGNIPMSLGQLSNLKNLDLSHNSFVGVLSETHFAKLKNLNHLKLSGNSLALNFSSRWIAPFQLQILYANSCNIGPHFPNWLQTQINLQRLDLSYSGIIDTIPGWFENILSHIMDLDLSNNQIGGKLPRFHFESSNQILDGVLLLLNSNKFEGSLATFPENVYYLDLSNNSLSGHVPPTYGRMNPNLMVVNLSKNRFTGSIPVQLCKVLNIELLNLSQNKFHGRLPGCLGNFSSLRAVNLSKNRFTGSIPVHLCKVLNILLLDLSQNKFYGRLPGCLGNLSNLFVIDLSNNTLSGVVPSSLGSLTSLVSLHLHNNIFEGDIPMSLQNLTSLITMDLGNNLFMGAIPFWIGEMLSHIKFLNLKSNKFTGKIPLQFCQLNTLQYLSLAHNNITGRIPHCLGNLSGMATDKDYIPIEILKSYDEYILADMKGTELFYTKIMRFLISIDLSNNNIVGEIPDALMNLVKLKNLNLSGNLITGHIPMSIGDLKQLESLDLSMNKLCGRIPQSLTSLNFLSYLNLSFNNLSGPIPVGNQLRTLDDQSIYEGNNGLCGPPVSKSCNGNGVTYNHVDDGDDAGQDDNEAGLWFYAGMSLGFVVGFTGLLGSLHFVRSWRVVYFETLETVYGWLMVSILVHLARLRRNVFK